MDKLTVEKLRQSYVMMANYRNEAPLWVKECDEIDRAIIYALDGIKCSSPVPTN